MAERLQPEFVAILDFGSQYAQLIARRVREAHVYCELLPPSVDPRGLDRNLKGAILSGGPASVYDAGAPPLPDWLKDSPVPVLSICYGMQLMAHTLGGTVQRAIRREYGGARIRVLDSGHPLFEGLPGQIEVWMSHGDQVEVLPPGFHAIAESENCAFAAIANATGSVGLQFHPEVVHTPLGGRILHNFLYRICGCSADWTPQRYIDDHVLSISQKIGSETALCALSGGVDSMVAATLVDRAIGDRLACFFVDTGMLREGEADEVMQGCEALDLNVRKVDAREVFLPALEGVVDPEEKRRIIGGLFIDVFAREAQILGNPPFLVQGTLYPDVIESATPENPNAAKIKTHHNVGGLPKQMPFTLVEPLRYQFKDEVREVGRTLGLPDRIIQRHPFPGPGLAVRIIGEITEERLALLRRADLIVTQEIERAGLYHDVW
ncbi:MAG: glutamine-hydrolyzing GMP synthase, partial [Chloroflexi bacterium]|nr:glutamine-hydrolyzing GMP synthase [Chloroflexota bacterium]